MARALPPASFVREAPTNHQSEVPVTATGHCPVPVLPRRAKTSFPGREAGPLRFAAPSAWVRKGSRAGLRSANASAVTLCCRGATPPSWLVRPHSSHTAHQHTQQDGRPQQQRQRACGGLPKEQKHRNSLGKPVAAVAALAPVCWFAPPPGASSPESALGVGLRLPQHEPGDLDTRDSGSENEPTLWAAPIPVLF